MIYSDRYERSQGRWQFRRRLPLYWYATDLNAPPIGENKMRWPDREPYTGGFHAPFPSWAHFWSNDYDPNTDVPAPAPLEHFLERIEPASEVSVRVR